MKTNASRLFRNALLLLSIQASVSLRAGANPGWQPAYGTTDEANYRVEIAVAGSPVAAIWDLNAKAFSHCLVERSANGVSFEELAFVSMPVAGSGETGSLFKDRSPAGSRRFYRLKMVTACGEVVYSAVSEVAVDPVMLASLTCAVKEHELHVVLPQNWTYKTGVVEILDARDNLLKMVRAGHNGSEVVVAVNDLKKGRYAVRIRSASHSLQQDFVK